MPKMLAGGHVPRIISVTGGFARQAKGYRLDDPNYTKREEEYAGFAAAGVTDPYTNTKIANLYFASTLARKSNGRVEAFCVSPGRKSR